MREFTITMPFTGIAVRTIEAESEEEAKEKFLNETIMSFDLRTGNVDDVEWDFCEQIVQGNVFYGLQNEMEIEDNGEVEE